MKVKFWGTRGSIAAPGKDTIVYGGNTCCVEILLNCGETVVIDSGSGMRPLGDHLMATRETVDIHLLMTHVHWDHVQGFPFFDPVFKPTPELPWTAHPGVSRGCAPFSTPEIGDGFFPIRFEHLRADIRYLDRLCHGPLKIQNTTITTVPLQHPQGGFGFRFEEDGKSFVFITDNELTRKIWRGKRIEDFVPFCRGADILVHDAQFLPEEIETYRGWGHSDYSTALELAHESRRQTSDPVSPRTLQNGPGRSAHRKKVPGTCR
jgi:phosphoribosyl 1,2-cyclic phosphodiesterase